MLIFRDTNNATFTPAAVYSYGNHVKYRSMEILILPLAIMANVFIIAPFIALIPAGIFGWLYVKSRKWSCLTAAILWAIYTPYEYGMYLRILCTGECNIRIDLFLIYPLLILVSLSAIILFMLRKKTSSHGPENQDKKARNPFYPN